MGYCTNCGEQLRANAQYCVECGARVSAVEKTDEQLPSRRRAIPRWLGVAIGVCAIVVLGVVIGEGVQPADNLAPVSPSPSAESTYQPSGWVGIDLVGNSGMLPTSPFYFAKGIGRNVQYAFTFAPIDKARLKLRFASEDALAVLSLCLDGEYVLAVTQCKQYQDHFFSSLAWIAKGHQEGDDVQAMLTAIKSAHYGQRVALGAAWRSVDEHESAAVIDAVIEAAAFTAAPLGAVIQSMEGHAEAVRFFVEIQTEFASLDPELWAKTEVLLGLSAENDAELAEAISDAANVVGAPIITNIQTKNTPFRPSATYPLRCTATDPQGDPVTYEWLATDGRILGQGEGVVWTAPKDPGIYKITVVVSDDKGNQSSKSFSVPVEEGRAKWNSGDTTPVQHTPVPVVPVGADSGQSKSDISG